MFKWSSVKVLSELAGDLKFPTGICYEPVHKKIYIANMRKQNVRWLNTDTGEKGVLPVQIRQPYKADRIGQPLGIGISPQKGILIADIVNNDILLLEEGSDMWVSVIKGVNSFIDDSGKEIPEPMLNMPGGVTTDTEHNIYINDFLNNRLRKIDKDGKLSTLTGDMDSGYEDGELELAKINKPYGVFYGNDKLYFVDQGNNLIRYIDFVTGKVQTVKPQSKEVRMDTPVAMTIDPDGNIFISEKNRIYCINAKTGEQTVVLDNEIWKTLSERFGINDELSYISALVTPDRGRLYWVDSNKSMAYSADYSI